MRSRHTLVSTFAALAASGLLVAGPPAAAQDATSPPGGREPAPTAVAPTAAAGVDPASAVSSVVAAGSLAGSTELPGEAAEAQGATRSADAESERRVRRIVLTLLAIAALMAATTLAFWWATKPVAPELGRLAQMSSRGFRRARPYERTEMLGASPLARLQRFERGPAEGASAGAAAAMPPPSVPGEPAEPLAPLEPAASRSDVSAVAGASGAALEPPMAPLEPAPAETRSPPDSESPGPDLAEVEPAASAVEPDPAVALERPLLGTATRESDGAVPEEERPSEPSGEVPVHNSVGHDARPGVERAKETPADAAAAEDEAADPQASAGPRST